MPIGVKIIVPRTTKCIGCSMIESKRNLGEAIEVECLGDEYDREKCQNGTKGRFDEYDNFKSNREIEKRKYCKGCIKWGHYAYEEDTQYENRCIATKEECKKCQNGKNGRWEAVFVPKK